MALPTAANPADKEHPTLDEEYNIMMALRVNPWDMMGYLLGESYTKKQIEIWEDVLNGDMSRIAVRAGNGVGKTFLLARIMLAYLMAWPNSLVPVVAPTQDSLRLLMFKELASAIAKDGERYNYFWRLNQSDMRIRVGESKEWMIFGRVTTSPERMLGNHAERMLVVVDEASGIEDWVMTAINAWMTSEHNKLVMIGNPTRNSGPFFKAFTINSELYSRHQISVFDTPNYTGEEVSEAIRKNLPQLKFEADHRVAAEAADDWYDYDIYVKAEFPTQDSFSLFNRQSIEACQKLELADNHEDVLYSSPVFGVDVARSGKDSTVIFLREGKRVKFIGQISGIEIPEVTEFIVHKVREHYAIMKNERAKYGVHMKQEHVAVHIDFNGLGSGPHDYTKRTFLASGEGFQVYAYNGGLSPYKPENKQNYNNRRSESWFGLSAKLNMKDIDIPKKETLMQELLAPKYYHSGGLDQRAVEKKELTKKLLGRSPDFADALVICFAGLDPKAGLAKNSEGVVQSYGA